DHHQGHQAAEGVDVDLALPRLAPPLDDRGRRSFRAQTIRPPRAPASASWTCLRSIVSGPAPTNSWVSPTTVLGTDDTLYLRARSGNPVTSTPSARMWSFSRAKRKARRTTRGQ